MLNIFLSGGMSGLSMGEMTRWRRLLKKEFDDYSVSKRVVSPTDYYTPNNSSDDVEKEAFLFDTYWARKCDVLIVNMNKPDSLGTAQEIMIAYEYKKPIIAIASKEKWGEVHPWIKIEVTKTFFWEDYDTEGDLYNEIVYYVNRYE